MAESSSCLWFSFFFFFWYVNCCFDLNIGEALFIYDRVYSHALSMGNLVNLHYVFLFDNVNGSWMLCFVGKLYGCRVHVRSKTYFTTWEQPLIIPVIVDLCCSFYCIASLTVRKNTDDSFVIFSKKKWIRQHLVVSKQASLLDSNSILTDPMTKAAIS